MQWFRWYHGTCTDPKFDGIALRAHARKSEVIALWALILETASAYDDRGLCHLSPAALGGALRMKAETAQRIVEGLETEGLLSSGRVVSWDKRQPKREDDSYQRVTKWRETQRNVDVTQCNALVTQCNAPDKTRLDTDPQPSTSARAREEMPATIWDKESDQALEQNWMHLRQELPAWITGPLQGKYVCALARAILAEEWTETELVARLHSHPPKTSDKFPDGYLRRMGLLRDKEREKMGTEKEPPLAHQVFDPSHHRAHDDQAKADAPFSASGWSRWLVEAMPVLGDQAVEVYESALAEYRQTGEVPAVPETELERSQA